MVKQKSQTVSFQKDQVILALVLGATLLATETFAKSEASLQHTSVWSSPSPNKGDVANSKKKRELQGYYDYYYGQYDSGYYDYDYNSYNYDSGYWYDYSVDNNYYYNSYYGYYDYTDSYYSYGYDYNSYYDYYDYSTDYYDYSQYYDYGYYYDYYDYYTYYSTDDYYGHDYSDGYFYYEDGDGNQDIDSAFIGSQDWDDWHEADGQSKDDEWTGDINDFLNSDDDRNHKEAIWSTDTEGPSFWDQVGEFLTPTHQQYAVAHDFDWITWAEMDTDFWEWFWIWFAELDNTWTFDHEPGFVQTDPDYEWEWFQNHTSGHNTTHDKLKIDRDDSEQWNWDTWDEFWNNYDAAIVAEDGFMYHMDKQQEKLKQDEDQVCANGSYLNEGKTCQPCPPGCSQCQSLGHCYSCEKNFEAVTGPDFGFCFPKCFHGMFRQTVYDFSVDFLTDIGVPEEEFEADADMKLVIPPHLMMKTCKVCEGNCRGCFAAIDGTQFCYECMHGFNFNKTEESCMADLSWNETNSEVHVRANKKSITQCETVKVRIDPVGGFDPVEGLKEVRWNIHVQDMEISEDLNGLIQNLITESNGESSFILSHEFTSKLDIGSKIKIIGLALGKDDVTVTDTAVLHVTYPPQYSLQYENSHYILAEEHFGLEIVKKHAQCPDGEKSIQKLDKDDWSLLSCKLYTVKKEFITDLQKCSIEKNRLDPGQTYLIRMEWEPHNDLLRTDTHRKEEVHHIRVTTQTTKTLCHFEEGDFLTIDPSISHVLKPVLQGQEKLISRAIWKCEMVGSDDQCPEQEKEANSLIQTTQFIPADYLPDKSIVMYTLTLEAATDKDQTNFEELASCSIHLLTPWTNKQPIELELIDEAPLVGFLEPKLSHTFYCSPQNPRAELEDITYDISIKEEISKDEISMAILQPEVVKNFNSLTVDASYFQPNKEYRVTCEASITNDDTKYGQISKQYNTNEFSDKMHFRIGPSRGAPYETVFDIELFKRPNEATKCSFGYKNSIGDVLIEDQSFAGQRFSASNQHLRSTLPAPEDGSNILEVFCRCVNSEGRSKQIEVPITIEGGDTVVFSEAANDRFAQSIRRSLEAGTKSRVSDLVALSAGVKVEGESEDADQGKQKELIGILTGAIAAQSEIKGTETLQLSQILNDLSVKIASNTELSADKHLTKTALQAVGNILTGSHAHVQVSDGPKTFETIDEDTFTQLAESLDMLLSSSSSMGDEGTTNAAMVVTEKLFNEGINRLAGSMYSGNKDDSSKSFNLKNFNMMVEKKSNEQFAKKNVNYVNLETHGGSELKIKIPFDPLFEKVDNLIFATSYSSQAGSQELLNKRQQKQVQDSKNLSGLVSVSIRAAQISKPADSVVSEVQVKNLQTPIKIQIPLEEGVKNPEQTQCMFLNEELQQWQVLKQSADCGIATPQLNQKMITCCSTHLTTFAVQEVKYFQQKVDQKPSTELPMNIDASKLPTEQVYEENNETEKEVDIQNSEEELLQLQNVTDANDIVQLEEENQICTAHLHFVMFVNLFLFLFAICGCCLDRKNMCIYTPGLRNNQKDDMQGDHMQIPNRSSINDSMKKDGLGEGTEMKNVTPVAPDQESGRGEENSDRVVGPDDIKVQMDDVVEAGKSQSQSSLGGESVQKQSASSINGSQRFSDIDLNATQEIKSDKVEMNATFGQVFCNSFRFYGRLLAIWYSHNPKLGRAAKSLNWATQVMLMATIVTMFGLFAENDDWKLSGPEYGAAFLLMRVFQGLLGFGLSRGEDTAKSFVWASTALIVIVYLVCQSIVYNTAERESRQVQGQIIGDSLRCFMIELFLWDMLLMPLTMATLVTCCFKKRRGLTNHFRACLV